MEVRPFAALRQTLRTTSHARILLAETPDSIEFLTYAEDNSTFASQVKHYPNLQVVVVGIQDQQAFNVWPGYPKFFGMVDQCISQVFKEESGTLNGFVSEVFRGDLVVMRYAIPVSYGTLEDDEYDTQVVQALSQCTRAMGLMYSINSAMLRKGCMITKAECMRAIHDGVSPDSYH